MTTRRVTLLGATGSIGRSTADVILQHRDRFSVEAVAGGRDAAALAEMAIRLGARFAAIADPGGLAPLRDALAGTGIASGAGEAAVLEAAQRPADLVVAGIAGTAGLRPTLAALQPGRMVALANKEALVCAGAAFMGEARRAGATILPMDSEHNAILQAMGRHGAGEIERMILTASGGPFRTWSAEEIAAARPEQALRHPNWSMGAKITIDSASLMNKGLELIEAHHLFAVPAERLGVVVHPQSIIHGLVTFADGAVVAGMGPPDMRVPIAHCLSFPDRLTTNSARLDLALLSRLDFEEPDERRFPALRLARTALAEGGNLSVVLNAANEVAVAAFLAGRMPFGAMAPLVERVLERIGSGGTDAVPRHAEDAIALHERTLRIAAEALAPAPILSH